MEHRTAFGWFSLLAGAATVLLSIFFLPSPPQDAAQQWSFVVTHQGPLMLLGVIVLVWAVLSIPLVVELGRLLEPLGPALARSAELLCTGGILLFAFATFAHVGAFLSIITANKGPTGTEATYQAVIWRNLSFYLSDPGLMTWGGGQFLFGWLARKSPALPTWLAVVGMLGGIAGLLTLAIYQSPLLALVQLVSFALWGITVGTLALRRG